jgi:DNA topoisomerase VI subunit B
MALRAFHANPSIGGFGGESTSAILLLDPNRKQDVGHLPQNGDALCQIVKELVDNAVDACETFRKDENQRVKVEILPNANNQDILQVTISDNGCGMADIQKCVDAFQSSKGDTKTAGRYGIGLTLCLLHAQRLVPNSYACISSATKEARNFTRALYVVDTQGDTVECHKQEEIPKTNKAESGTCVSLLVPVSQKETKIDKDLLCIS